MPEDNKEKSTEKTPAGLPHQANKPPPLHFYTTWLGFNSLPWQRKEQVPHAGKSYSE